MQMVFVSAMEAAVEQSTPELWQRGRTSVAHGVAESHDERTKRCGDSFDRELR